MTSLPDPATRKEYRRRFFRFLKVHKRPGLALFYLFHMTMHHHANMMARGMITGKKQIVNSF